AFIRKPIPYDQLLSTLADIKRSGKTSPPPKTKSAPEPEAGPQKAQNWDGGGDPLLDMSILNGLLDTLGRDQLKTLLQSCLDKITEILAALNTDAARTDLKLLLDRSHE